MSEMKKEALTKEQLEEIRNAAGGTGSQGGPDCKVLCAETAEQKWASGISCEEALQVCRKMYSDALSDSTIRIIVTYVYKLHGHLQN